MENVVNEMPGKSPDVHLRYRILLSAHLAKPAGYRGSAIEAVLFLTFWLVGHVKFFLKIGTKTPLLILILALTKALYIFGQTIS